MMKTFITFLVIAFLGICNAQQKIPESELEKYVDKKIEYCNRVHGTFVSKGNKKVILLNMGADYPNHELVIAIFEGDWKKFDYKPAEFLKGKDICITGKLVMYKGKPEIIVNNPNQISVQ